VIEAGDGLWRCPLDLDPDRLARRVGSWPDAALLEGGPGFGDAARWGLFAAHPRRVVEADGARGRLDAWAALEPACMRPPAREPDPDLPPFRGGLIGFLGYDLATEIERLPRRAPRDSRLPDLRFGLYDTFATFDRLRGTVELWAADLDGAGEAACRARLDRWREALREPEPAPRPPRLIVPPRSNFARTEYLRAVRRALDYIAAGDVFQVNLAQRFEARAEVDPLELYLRLKRRSPAPFGAFLRWGDLAVVSASPEWFYQTRGRRIVTRPIKGTRPRGRDEAEDARLAGELRASPKDRAELTMIVDLERNDLGRVCEYGSVRVSEALAVESFAQVHHLVATVEGVLREGVGALDVVRAVFPGGSITGAPKIRAMEIIDELEPNRRGLYTGAIGYVSRDGTSAFNIAIRTIVVEGDRLHYGVGGGIVADSVPEAEFEETLHKGRALREVIEGGGAGP
jgi:para-aminobenzoate synthetase component 1